VLTLILHNWTNFFDITAAAGGQLIGLMFVVVTLWTGLSKSQAVDGIRAFLTPTTICFSGALFQGLVVLAPWQSDRPIGFTLALTGRGRYLRRATRAAHRTAGQGARRYRRLARFGGVGTPIAPA